MRFSAKYEVLAEASGLQTEHAYSMYLEHWQLLPLLLYGKGSIRIVNNGCCRVFS